jgi:4-hydroxy-2-oxoglutarate aldolase
MISLMSGGFQGTTEVVHNTDKHSLSTTRGKPMESHLSLEGCFPPIPTPFDGKGRIAHDQLRLNLDRWQTTPLTGFVVLGSNGEAVLLSEQEKVAVWKTARAAIRKDHLFIAGTGCEATVETLEVTEEAARCGADAAMVVTPHYYKGKMDHRALLAHYTFLADRSPIPIILYNVPANTGVDMAAETMIALADHVNIIGVKDSSGNIVKVGRVATVTRGRFQVLAGSGGFLLAALAVGAVGGVMALACVAPTLVSEIVSSFERGDREKARDIQGRLIPVNTAVTTRFGIPGLKAALDLLGMYGGPVRSPLLSLRKPEKEELERILGEGGLLDS